MREKKYYIALGDFERRVVVNCMNEMRNRATEIINHDIIYT